jgi:hypothetical protein
MADAERARGLLRQARLELGVDGAPTSVNFDAAFHLLFDAFEEMLAAPATTAAVGSRRAARDGAPRRLDPIVLVADARDPKPCDCGRGRPHAVTRFLRWRVNGMPFARWACDESLIPRTDEILAAIREAEQPQERA